MITFVATKQTLTIMNQTMKDLNLDIQKSALAEGNKVPNMGTDLNPVMTTEEFHQLLEENTRKQNELRVERQERMADLQEAYSTTIDAIVGQEHAVTDALRKRRAEFEEAKRFYDLAIRGYAKDRNLAGQKYNKGKAELIGEFSTRNEQLQMERHDIFERYKRSGGIVEDMEGLLHLEWRRKKKAGGSEDE